MRSVVQKNCTKFCILHQNDLIIFYHYQSMQNSHKWIICSFLNSQKSLVLQNSDVTTDVNTASAEDRLLIKTLWTENSWRVDSVGCCWSVRSDLNIKLVNDLICTQDSHCWSLILRVMFPCCRLYFYHDCLEICCRHLCFYAAKQIIFKCNINNILNLFLTYFINICWKPCDSDSQLQIYEWCSEFCAFLSEPSCMKVSTALTILTFILCQLSQPLTANTYRNYLYVSVSHQSHKWLADK